MDTDEAARRRELDLAAREAELNRRAAQLDRRESELLVLADELATHDGPTVHDHSLVRRAFALPQTREDEAGEDAWWAKVLGRRRPSG